MENGDAYYDYSSDRGWVAMSRRTYERYWRGGGCSSIEVYARPGVGDARLRAAEEARLPEGLAVGAALLAGIYPARRAARSSPAAVLHND